LISKADFEIKKRYQHLVTLSWQNWVTTEAPRMAYKAAIAVALVRLA